MRGFVLFVLQIALVSGCSDTSADCSYYKEAGYCESYGDTLKEMCAKSCGFCSGGGGGDGGEPGTAVDPRPEREPESMELCRDTCSTKDCEWYKTQSHCEKYSAVMVMNCAQTCGWCGATLCTPPDVENGWTDFEMIMIPAGATVNVYCYEGFKNMGYGQLTCGAFGEMEGSARCEEIGGDDSRYPAPEETACQRAAKSAMEPTYVNAQYVIPQVSTHYVPQCDDYEGNYKEIQYDGGKGETFCADMYRGIEIQGTRIQGKHEYISCAPGSAKDYYERLALERGASNSGSDGYNYDTYDNSESSYDYNYDNSDTSYDYNYDNSETSYDYNYDSSGSTSAGGDADSSYDYNYDNSDSGYDYNYDNSDSGYDYNYDNSGSAGEDAGYETSGDDDYYVAGGEDYYVAPDDGYTASDDGYYAGDDGYYAGDDSYYAGGDGYAAGGDGYAAGGDGYAAGGDGYYVAGGDGYAAGGDGYAAGGDGYATGGDGYAAGDDGYYAGDDGYYAGDDGYYAGGSDGYASGGDAYYDDGDGFDNSYYYTEGDSEEEVAAVETEVASEPEKVVEEVIMEEEVEENTKDARRRNKKRRRNKREADAEPADE